MCFKHDDRCVSRFIIEFVFFKLDLYYNFHKIHNQLANIVKINLVVRLVLEMVRFGSGTLSPRNGTLRPGTLRQWYASSIIRPDPYSPSNSLPKSILPGQIGLLWVVCKIYWPKQNMSVRDLSIKRRPNILKTSGQ